MGAIIGRFELDGRPVDVGLFGEAMSAVAHYGGNGTGRHIDGDIALGQHLGPEATGRTTGALTLNGKVAVCDAHFHGLDDLGQKLGLAPSAAHSLPATHLVIQAYEKWGAGCTQHLYGDYCFAIHDPAARTLFAARDHIGARPLYWSRQADTVVFATDLRGLMAFGDLSWAADEDSIAEFLWYPTRPPSSPFFKETWRLAPGDHLLISGRDIRTQRWWSPPIGPSGAPRRAETVVEELREHLARAVDDRITTSQRIGSHTTGGIDSTVVTLTAQNRLRAQGRSLSHAYTWSPPVSEAYPDEGDNDERRRISQLCRHICVPLGFGAEKGQGYRSYLDRPIELDGTADLFEEIGVMADARDAGIAVLLSGWGGDECFSMKGEGLLAELVLAGRLRRAIGLVTPSGRRLPPARRLLRTLWKGVALPLLPDRAYTAVSGPHLFQDGCFLNPELSAATRSQERARQPYLREMPGPHRNSMALFRNGHIGERMATWAAWSARFGIVHRYPLTDRRLLEFLLTLPPDLNVHDGQRRYLARSAVDDPIALASRKTDTINEKARQDAAWQCWRLLRDDLEGGRFDRDCPWLDMPALRTEIANPPEAMSRDNFMKFARVSAAMRVYSAFMRVRSATGGA